MNTIREIFKEKNKEIIIQLAESYRIAKENPKDNDEIGTLLEEIHTRMELLIYDTRKECEAREKTLIQHCDDLRQEILVVRKKLEKC